NDAGSYFGFAFADLIHIMLGAAKSAIFLPFKNFFKADKAARGIALGNSAAKAFRGQQCFFIAGEIAAIALTENLGAAKTALQTIHAFRDKLWLRGGKALQHRFRRALVLDNG